MKTTEHSTTDLALLSLEDMPGVGSLQPLSCGMVLDGRDILHMKVKTKIIQFKKNKSKIIMILYYI